MTETGKETEIDIETIRKTDRQSDRQTDKHTGRQKETNGICLGSKQEVTYGQP